MGWGEENERNGKIQEAGRGGMALRKLIGHDAAKSADFDGDESVGSRELPDFGKSGFRRALLR